MNGGIEAELPPFPVPSQHNRGESPLSLPNMVENSCLNLPNEYNPPRDTRSPNESRDEGKEKDVTIYVDEVADADIDSVASSFEPITSSEAEKEGYPRLDYRPFPIGTYVLSVTLLFLLGLIGGIATIILLGHRDQRFGVCYYTTSYYNRLAIRYTPTLIGTLTTIWWHTITTTLGRVTPYISMAASKENDNNNNKIGRNYSKNSLQNSSDMLLRTLRTDYAGDVLSFNAINAARNRHWLLFSTIVVHYLMTMIIVPLKAPFIQVFDNGENAWVVVIMPAVGYTLMAIYGVLALAACTIIFRLSNRELGLRWDPVSIADQLALVQGSNILKLFQGLEFANCKECTKVLEKRWRSSRLGYWKVQENGDTRIWYGLAYKQSVLEYRPPLQVEADETNLSRMVHAEYGDKYMDPIDFNHQPVLNPQNYRYRSVPFFQQDTILATFALGLIAAVLLTILGLRKHIVQQGFFYSYANFSDFTEIVATGIRLPITQIEYFEESFKYRFVPVLFMTIFSNLWIYADRTFRTLQPFHGMDQPAPAKSNILLHYPSILPLSVTIKAIKNYHWRVALFSTLSLLSAIPPIIATGIFVLAPITSGDLTNPTGLSVSIEPANFWAMFITVILYLFFLPMARPTSGYRLPRYPKSISDTLSYCYASRILDDISPDGKTPVFSAQGHTQGDLKARIVYSKEDYVFGLYVGKDERLHVGFDVANRRGMHVIRFDPGWRLFGGIFNWYMRKPRAIKNETEEGTCLL